MYAYICMIYTHEQSTCACMHCPHLQHCRAVLSSLTVCKLSNQSLPIVWRKHTFSQQKFPQLGQGSWGMGRAVWPHLQPESGATQRPPYHLFPFQVDMGELFNRMSYGGICPSVSLYNEYKQVDACICTLQYMGNH